MNVYLNEQIYINRFMHIAKNLKLIREKWRLNQAEMGKLLGAARTTVAKWEKAGSEPTLSALLWLEANAGVSGRRLYYEEINEDEVSRSPGENSGEIGKKEESKLKIRLADVVMEMADVKEENRELVEALVTVIEYLESTMDESVYLEDKKALMAKLVARVDGSGKK